MPRAMWSGSISFGLVNIPIRMFAGVGDKAVRFNLLHKEDHHRLRNRRICPAHEPPVEVDRDETVKGYEVAPDQYVTVSKEELDALEPERQRTIEIEAFVDLEAIDPIHFDRSYFLAPDGTGAKAYRLLLEVMQRAGRVAVGRFVMRTKEYLAALRPRQEGLVLETLHYHDEVRSQAEVMEAVDLPDEVAEAEVDLALQVVEALTRSWDPSDYEDTYRARVMEMLERKQRGEEVVVPERESAAPAGEDLMAALRASLDQGGDQDGGQDGQPRMAEGHA